MKQRESFSSRLGFLLISAGCAIGLGNVWRFPYITGQYGGAAFVVVYLLFLVIMGLPVMVMEFSVGRGSQKSMAGSFQALEPKGTRWHWYSWFGLAGNYLLMMFYTSVSGLLILYCIKMAKGDFHGLDTAGVSQEFGNMLSQPGLMTVFMVLVVVGSMLVVSRGLQNGVEKINKTMMLCLLAVMVLLAVRSLTLEGGMEGLAFYLMPNFHNLMYDAQGNFILWEAIYACHGSGLLYPVSGHRSSGHLRQLHWQGAHPPRRGPACWASTCGADSSLWGLAPPSWIWRTSWSATTFCLWAPWCICCSASPARAGAGTTSWPRPTLARACASPAMCVSM